MRIPYSISINIGRLLKKNGKSDFLSKLNHNSKILDVGCGNNSHQRVKQILPDCEYTGVDVCNYNQDSPESIDNYILTTSEMFAYEIKKLNNRYDAVISRHNLEHCEQRELTLEAMLESLKIGGKIFLSFPCEESISFPSRGGTLNYYDDATHKLEPPHFDYIVSTIKSYGFEILYSDNSYSPPVLKFVGLLLEPLSRRMNKVMPGTWELYGFEAIIIAKRIK